MKNKKSKKIGEALVKASEKYDSNPILRSVITLIPYIGSALDILIQEKWNKKRQERINYFFESIKNELNDIEEEKINKSFLETDEFSDLVFNCISNSAKSRNKEKIELFAKILRNAVCDPDFDFDIYEEVEVIIERLTAKELQFLKIIENWEHNIENNYMEMLDISEIRNDPYNTGFNGIPKYFSFWEKFKEEVEDQLKITENEFNLLTTVLQQKGLIKIGTINYSHKSPFQAARETFKPTMNAKLTKIYSLLKQYIADKK